MDRVIILIFVCTLLASNKVKFAVGGNVITGFFNFFTENSNEENKDGVAIYNRRKRISADGENPADDNFSTDSIVKRNIDEQLNDEILNYAKYNQISPEKTRRDVEIDATNITLIEQSVKLTSSNDKPVEYGGEENTIRTGRSKFEKVNSREEKEMSSIKTISSLSVPAQRKFLDDESGSGADEDYPLTEAFEWPKGRYGLPKSIYGCPNTFDVSWKTGFRYHDTEDDGTENQRSDVFHLAANFSEDGISHEFCIKDNVGGEGEWPSGKYCIYKRAASCPTNMKEGFVMWDDENTDNQNDKGGALPAGQYTEDTKIYFCCSVSGFVENQISLPAKRPFFLFAYESARCQKVLNMKVTSEFIKFDDEDHGNTDYEYGEYPYGIHKFQKDHMLFLCFYEPSKPVVSYYSEAAMKTNLEDENLNNGDVDQESLRQGEEIMKAFMKETGGVEDSDNKKERSGKTIIKTIKVPVHSKGSPIAIVLGLVLGSVVIGTAIIFMAKLVMNNPNPPQKHSKDPSEKVETTWTDPNINTPLLNSFSQVIDTADCSEEEGNDCRENDSDGSNEEIPDTWSDLDEDNELVEDQLLPDSELKSGLELLFLKQQRHYWNQRRQHQRKEDFS